MRIETLKNPGTYINGLQLRSQACVAISAAEQYMQADSKQALTDFFYDCAIKAGGSPLPSTSAVVANAGTQLVSNSAGVTTTVSGTYTVSAGAVTSFRLPATAQIVRNAVDIVVPVTGTYATKIAATVVNGVITGFVLS